MKGEPYLKQLYFYWVAASDRKLSVCLCKNVVNNWIDIFGAETSCEEIENQVKCYKKRQPTTESF